MTDDVSARVIVVEWIRWTEKHIRNSTPLSVQRLNSDAAIPRSNTDINIHSALVRLLWVAKNNVCQRSTQSFYNKYWKSPIYEDNSRPFLAIICDDRLLILPPNKLYCVRQSCAKCYMLECEYTNAHPKCWYTTRSRYTALICPTARSAFSIEVHRDLSRISPMAQFSARPMVLRVDDYLCTEAAQSVCARAYAVSVPKNFLNARRGICVLCFGLIATYSYMLRPLPSYTFRIAHAQ